MFDAPAHAGCDLFQACVGPKKPRRSGSSRVVKAKLCPNAQPVSPLADGIAQVILVLVGLAALVDDEVCLSFWCVLDQGGHA